MTQCGSIFRRVAARRTCGRRWCGAANRAIRLRAAAELIADVVPPPHGVYARTRKVLETHTEAVCRQVTGETAGPALPPISDDFVIALRAEAADDDLAVAAALPLVTVAAHLGELEMLYPRGDSGPHRRARRQTRCGISAFGGMAPNLPAL